MKSWSSMNLFINSDFNEIVMRSSMFPLLIMNHIGSLIWADELYQWRFVFFYIFILPLDVMCFILLYCEWTLFLSRAIFSLHRVFIFLRFFKFFKEYWFVGSPMMSHCKASLVPFGTFFYRMYVTFFKRKDQFQYLFRCKLWMTALCVSRITQ